MTFSIMTLRITIEHDIKIITLSIIKSVVMLGVGYSQCH
jgi:hypothetical protein